MFITEAAFQLCSMPPSSPSYSNHFTFPTLKPLSAVPYVGDSDLTLSWCPMFTTSWSPAMCTPPLLAPHSAALPDPRVSAGSDVPPTLLCTALGWWHQRYPLDLGTVRGNCVTGFCTQLTSYLKYGKSKNRSQFHCKAWWRLQYE